MRRITIFVLATLMLLNVSCTQFFYKIYGIEIFDKFDEEKYELTLSQLKSLYPEYKMTSVVSSMNKFQQFHQSFSDLSIKNLSQPIQILYFRNNKLISYHLNCYAKGGLKGNLKWNYDNKFDKYIPETAYPVPDSLSSDLDVLFNIYELEKISSKDDVVVIFWTNMLRKTVIDAYKLVVDNIRKYNKGTDPPIILINTDIFFIEASEEDQE